MIPGVLYGGARGAVAIETPRKELVKAINGMGEETRVRIRGFRRDALDTAKKQKKDSKLTEDQLKDFEADAQKLTDKFSKSIDDHIAHKEAEIMRV